MFQSKKTKKELVGEVPSSNCLCFFPFQLYVFVFVLSSNENFTAKLLPSFSEEKGAWSENN
jgi:hypothetical protein